MYITQLCRYRALCERATRRVYPAISVDELPFVNNFRLSVLGLEPGDQSRQYDQSDWKEYFCVLEREPPAIRIFLDEQVSSKTFGILS